MTDTPAPDARALDPAAYADAKRRLLLEVGRRIQPTLDVGHVSSMTDDEAKRALQRIGYHGGRSLRRA